jgi:hypothetical protein
MIQKGRVSSRCTGVTINLQSECKKTANTLRDPSEANLLLVALTKLEQSHRMLAGGALNLKLLPVVGRHPGGR